MKSAVLAVITMLSTAVPAALAAQQRSWELAVQGGAAFPATDLYDTDLKTGFGFEGTLSYRFTPSIGVYAGWDWHKFITDVAGTSFIGADVDVEETGYVLGLQYEFPLGGSPNSPSVVLRGGGTLNHLELSDSSGNELTDTGHGVGYEVGVGFAVPLGDRFRLVPAARYRSLDRDLTVNGVTRGVTLSYGTAELGLRVSF